MSSPREVDPSLTSFPSFSPEPETKGEDKGSKAPAVARTISQKARERKATLAGLTSASSVLGQNALFDDSPRSSLDIPGSLHLASDDHIERLIARTGAVKLIRQYAKDLAQRDAEISKLRVSAEIEKTLMRLEMGDDESSDSAQKSRTSIDGLMNEAIASEMTLSPLKPVSDIAMAPPSHSSAPSLPQIGTRTRGASNNGKRSGTSSRVSSRTNSIQSLASEDMDATLRPRVSSTNASKLQSMFQPPNQSTSYFIGGKSLKKPKAADEVSVRSNQSSKSFASWTQIFGGRAQTGRNRSSSLEQGAASPQRPSEAESALSKLAKTKTQPASIRGGQSTVKGKPSARAAPAAARLSTSPNHVRKDSNASQPLTVEMDSVLQPDTLPPSMTTNNMDTSGVLTDRFGFIYDQRRRKRQTIAIPKSRLNRLSATESSTSKLGTSPNKDPVDRASTPISNDDESHKRSWQDYLRPSLAVTAGRPTELLSHAPSATAVVTVNTADIEGTITPPRGGRARGASVSANEHGLLPSTTSVSERQSSTATAEHEVDGLGSETASLRLLLEITDSLQNERQQRWHEFLRKIRAERANNPNVSDAPETELLDGELIGVASLGRSAKYNQFKSLVLAGIPISLRAAVWAEGSGALASKIPGYYEDLVMRSEEGTEIDPDIRDQISADVQRTLTDNIYFRSASGVKGPGVDRLNEVLLAFSLHQRSIGYCQGMNLIAASLLLICATPEDCFWLLVAVIDTILPSGYFNGALIVARSDQLVLRGYVRQLLPDLSSKLDELGVELEACTFHWFLSLYAGVLTGGEALYRIWDIVLTLHSSEAPNFASEGRVDLSALNATNSGTPATPTIANKPDPGPDPPSSELNAHDGTASPFLFQLALALLYLNQSQIMALETSTQVYTFINHNITNHDIDLSNLIRAATALSSKIKFKDVLERRERAKKSLGG
jgi:small G protein signaling modulator 3